MLKKTVEVTLLFDYYGRLLTEKQQKIFALYYFQDLSLAEVAEKLQISRQGVHDHLQRGEKILSEYENKLGQANRAGKIRRKLDEILALLESNSISNRKVKTISNKVKKIKQLL